LFVVVNNMIIFAHN